MKITVEAPASSELLSDSELVSAVELATGDYVYFAGTHGEVELGSSTLRLTTHEQMFEVRTGRVANDSSDTEKMYRRLPIGTKITLEVTK